MLKEKIRKCSVAWITALVLLQPINRTWFYHRSYCRLN